MSSKRELREQIALMRGDVEAWRRTAERFAVSRDKAVSERDAVFGDLVTTREQRDDARDELAQAIAEREEMAEEVVAVRAELARAQVEIREARARIAEFEDTILDHATTEPETEPRPFRVGDWVRVVEGATFRVGLSGTLASRSAGRVGVVSEVWDDGDLIIDTDAEGFCYVSPEFCTLIEAAPEPSAPATSSTPTGVTLHTHDGRELWIPCEDPDVDPDVDDSKGLWIMPAGRGREAVAWVNTVAIVAAVVTR